MKFIDSGIFLTGLLLQVFLGALVFSASAQATGPRITHSLLSPESREIYAADVPPFVSSDIANQGFVAEIVETALTAAGVDAVISTQPLQKMVKYYLLQENTLASLGINLDFTAEERKNLIAVPVFVAEQRYYAYKTGNPSVTKWAGELGNLKGLAYGALEGENLSAYKNAGIQVEQARALSLLKSLKEKKLDFVGMPALTADWLINKHFANEKNNFIAMQPVAGLTTISLYFNKKHPKGEAAAKKFTDAFTSMLNDGRYLKILENHLGKSDDLKVHIKRLEQVSGK